jgi:hypothetical protein
MSASTEGHLNLHFGLRPIVTSTYDIKEIKKRRKEKKRFPLILVLRETKQVKVHIYYTVSLYARLWPVGALNSSTTLKSTWRADSEALSTEQSSWLSTWAVCAIYTRRLSSETMPGGGHKEAWSFLLGELWILASSESGNDVPLDVFCAACFSS